MVTLLLIFSLTLTAPVLAITHGTHFSRKCPNGIKPLLKDRTKYLQRIHNKFKERLCPPGTMFDPNECMCSISYDSLPFDATGSPFGEYYTTTIPSTSDASSNSKDKVSSGQVIDYAGSYFGLSQRSHQQSQGDIAVNTDVFKQQITSVIDKQEISKSNQNVLSKMDDKTKTSTNVMVYNFYNEPTTPQSPFLLDTLIGPTKQPDMYQVNTKQKSETPKEQTFAAYSSFVRTKVEDNTSIIVDSAKVIASSSQTIYENSTETKNQSLSNDSNVIGIAKDKITPTIKEKSEAKSPGTFYANGLFSFKTGGRKEILIPELVSTTSTTTPTTPLVTSTPSSNSSTIVPTNNTNAKTKLSVLMKEIIQKGLPKKYLHLFKDLNNIKLDFMSSQFNASLLEKKSEDKTPKQSKSRNKISINWVKKSKQNAGQKSLSTKKQNKIVGQVKNSNSRQNVRFQGNANADSMESKQNSFRNLNPRFGSKTIPMQQNLLKISQSTERPWMKLPNPTENGDGVLALPSGLSNLAFKALTTKSPQPQITDQIRPWNSWSQAETKFISEGSSAYKTMNSPVDNVQGALYSRNQSPPNKVKKVRNLQNNGLNVKLPMNSPVDNVQAALYSRNQSPPNKVTKVRNLQNNGLNVKLRTLQKNIPMRFQNRGPATNQVNLSNRLNKFNGKQKGPYSQLLYQKQPPLSQTPMTRQITGAPIQQNMQADLFYKLLMKQNQNQKQLPQNAMLSPFAQTLNNINSKTPDNTLLQAMMGSNYPAIQSFNNNPFQSLTTRSNDPIDYADMIEAAQNRRAGPEAEGVGDLNEQMRARQSAMGALNQQMLLGMQMQGLNSPVHQALNRHTGGSSFYHLFSKTAEHGTTRGANRNNLASKSSVKAPLNNLHVMQPNINTKNMNRVSTHSSPSDLSSSLTGFSQPAYMKTLFGGMAQTKPVETRTQSGSFLLDQFKQPKLPGGNGVNTFSQPQFSGWMPKARNSGLSNFFRSEMNKMDTPANLMKNMHAFLNG